jgi:hypothetical protein
LAAAGASRVPSALGDPFSAVANAAEKQTQANIIGAHRVKSFLAIARQ